MTFLLTALALVAFAANSLLCRMALGGGLIDPVSFTTLRLVGGALALSLLARAVASISRRGAPRQEAAERQPAGSGGSWASGLALFVYAAGFSLAYVSLSTGMGALILFAAVQVTMIGAALRLGERLGPSGWVGAAAALTGLVYLTLPGLTAPSPLAALSMAAAGVAWGVYSIRGRAAQAPIAMTAGNFVRSVPFVVVAGVFALARVHAEPAGVALALTSGVVTSGLGYFIWYRALRGLTTIQASLSQLLVPVLAAAAGIVLLAEPLTGRLVTASALILGGMLLAVLRRRRPAAAGGR